MQADSGVALTELKVDGGMVVNELLMQFQADILDVPVVRPRVNETTALGAAYAAGTGRGLLERPRRAAEQLAGGAPLVSGDAGGGPGCLLRQVAKSGRSLPRLGRAGIGGGWGVVLPDRRNCYLGT